MFLKPTLAGRRAWITGASSGLGRALALELAHRGVEVALSSRRAALLEEVARTIADDGGRAHVFPCDVTDESQVRETFEALERRLGGLDIAVANAGFGVAGPFETIDAEHWRRQLDVNVVGAASTLRAALPALRVARGRAVVVSSILGRMGIAGSAPYCASKHALIGMCDALRLELHGSGVSVTNVLPGVVASNIDRVDNHDVFHPERVDSRPAWLMWPADRAARVIADAIAARRRELVFTAHGRIAALLGQHLPGPLYWLMPRVGITGRRFAEAITDTVPR